jgi:hypothetical protein
MLRGELRLSGSTVFPFSPQGNRSSPGRRGSSRPLTRNVGTSHRQRLEHLFYAIGMRHGDPVKIREAQRAGTLARLTRGGRISPERAEALLGAWEAEAAERGLLPGSNAYKLEKDVWITSLGR